MALILGIDAAWTKAGSSGIALLETRNGRRTVVPTANQIRTY
jgi:predicted RNase H-like nuclease